MVEDTKIDALEKRKIDEIKHSDKRRSIVKGYEYNSDANIKDTIGQFISGSEDYAKHFSNMKFYSISRSSFTYRDTLLFESIKDAIALDYCCGNGEIAIEMAKKGASRVVGIDLSSIAIENATNLAKKAGIQHICEFHVMDAENTSFADNTFDIIHEYGALHHLELNSAFSELCRILKPEGKLICTEAMRHNPLIHWYRKKTPHLRTKWEVEHILGVPELKNGKQYFRNINLKMFHLAALAAVPFRKSSFFDTFLPFLEQLDEILLSLPYVKLLAWIAIVEYRNPRKYL